MRLYLPSGQKIVSEIIIADRREAPQLQEAQTGIAQMHQEITMRLSHLTAIAAVAFGLGTGAALAGPDYPNNALRHSRRPSATHQVRELRRVHVRAGDGGLSEQ